MIEMKFPYQITEIGFDLQEHCHKTANRFNLVIVEDAERLYVKGARFELVSGQVMVDSWEEMLMVLTLFSRLIDGEAPVDELFIGPHDSTT